ncbi:uncharacterized protein IAS62_002635 [Cryptococcus decagattii]|uniref:Uncharacterized protein n=1 Tax=Cryptococcus decagattii TaxID=1859122 RepID=A0ABZ2ASF7_9TREE
MMHNPNAVRPNVCGKNVCSSNNSFQARSSAPSSAPRPQQVVVGSICIGVSPYCTQTSWIAILNANFRRYKESVMAPHSRAAFYIRVS